MLNTKDRFELYEKAKTLLQKDGFTVNPYREIQYGLQFLVSTEHDSELLRIYESKKNGLRIDYSQCKDPAFLNALKAILDDNPKLAKPAKNNIDQKKADVTKLGDSTQDPDDLIGIDESGKGDYFGPLVIAGVRINDEAKEKLDGLGIQDSKKLSEKAILFLAKKITEHCQHTVIVMGNHSYNEIYDKFQNLNHILAWAHMKVLEDTLKQGDCPNALCDQFADPSLLQSSLAAKNLNVNLYQRPRAESNLAVACASILARANFVTELKKMETHYGTSFPKGCSEATVKAAQDFIDSFGKKELNFIAKLHFKLTDQLT